LLNVAMFCGGTRWVDSAKPIKREIVGFSRHVASTAFG
jgi:hypothetical protein